MKFCLSQKSNKDLQIWVWRPLVEAQSSSLNLLGMTYLNGEIWSRKEISSQIKVLLAPLEIKIPTFGLVFF